MAAVVRGASRGLRLDQLRPHLRGARSGDTRWRRTLERVVAAGPTHISCYELTVEPGTPLHTQVRRGLVTPVDGARSHAPAPHRRRARSKRAGYEQYEVSNFATPGRGLQAQPRLLAQRLLRSQPGLERTGTYRQPRRRRSASTSSPAPCRCATGTGGDRRLRAGDPRRGPLPVTGSETVGPGMREQERLMLGLRLREGVRIDPTRVAEGPIARGARGSWSSTAIGSAQLSAVRRCSTR